MRLPTPWLLLPFVAVSAHAQAPDPKITLLGRVITVTGDGVPAARVQAQSLANAPLGQTVADGDGYFQMRAVTPLPELELHITAPGMLAPIWRVDRRAGDAAIEVIMMDAMPLAGTIKAADGSVPANAVIAVRAMWVENSSVTWQTETTADARGNYLFSAVPAQPLLVSAWAPGCEPLMAIRRVDGTTPVDLTLPTGAARPRTIHVRGVPAGVTATVFQATSAQSGGMLLPKALSEATVDAEGRALLWPLPFAHVLGVQAPGCSTAPLRIHVRNASDADQAFDLTRDPERPTTTLRGILVDELGHPLPDLLVRCAELSGADERQIRSAADGTFTITTTVSPNTLCRFALPPGTWRIGHPAAQLDHGGVTWWDTKATPDAVIKLHARRGALITGKAHDEAGGVLRHATVELLFAANARPPFVARTISDRNGAFAFPGLPGGSYQLRVRTPTRRTGTANVKVDEPGAEEVDAFVFEPCGELTGVLRDDLGAPIAGADILDTTRGGRAARIPRFVASSSTRTDRNGRFRIPVLQPGTRTFVANDLVLGPSQSTEVNIEPGATATIELTLPRK